MSLLTFRLSPGLSALGSSKSVLLRSCVTNSFPRSIHTLPLPQLTRPSRRNTPSQTKLIAISPPARKMSTSDKPADPYTTKAKEDVPLKEKVEEFTTFIKTCKFGMMTTRVKETQQMTSRAMALAATVRIPNPCSSLYPTKANLQDPITLCLFHHLYPSIHKPTNTASPHRKTTASTSSSTQTPNPAKPTP